MTKTEGSTGPIDPFESWKELYEANERAWTTALEETMARPEFSESSGKMLDTMLAAQKAVRDNMRSYLEAMNVPTREDIARLGELVVGLEEKVDQVVDRLDTIEDAVRVDIRSHLDAMSIPTREDISRLGELVVGLGKNVDQAVARFAKVESAISRMTAKAVTPPKAATPPKGTTPEKRSKPAARAKSATRAKPATTTEPANPAR